MTSFVLVHGGAHASWCWERLIPHLESDPRVDQVLAVDLCGHGARAEAKPFLEIGVEDYVGSVLEDLEKDDLRDITLVGHSLAGLTLPHVATRASDRIARVVYLSTTNPCLGRSVLDEMAESPHFSASGGSELDEAFCSDLDSESAEWLLARMGTQPPGPLDEASRLVAGPTEIPSTYVLLESDAVLSTAFQEQQAERLAVDEVIRFDAGHSAFASRPKDLAKLFLELA